VQKLGKGSHEPHFVGDLLLRREQEPLFAFDQPGIELRIDEGRKSHEAGQEIDVVRDADHSVLSQRSPHAGQRLLAIGSPDDQLGNHRIIVGGDLVALLDPGINANRVALGRRNKMNEAAGRRQEAFIRILGIDARLDCMTVDLELLLGQGATADHWRPEAATRRDRVR